MSTGRKYKPWELAELERLGRELMDLARIASEGENRASPKEEASRRDAQDEGRRIRQS